MEELMKKKMRCEEKDIKFKLKDRKIKECVCTRVYFVIYVLLIF